MNGLNASPPKKQFPAHLPLHHTNTAFVRHIIYNGGVIMMFVRGWEHNTNYPTSIKTYSQVVQLSGTDLPIFYVRQWVTKSHHQQSAPPDPDSSFEESSFPSLAATREMATITTTMTWIRMWVDEKKNEKWNFQQTIENCITSPSLREAGVVVISIHCWLSNNKISETMAYLLRS